MLQEVQSSAAFPRKYPSSRSPLSDGSDRKRDAFNRTLIRVRHLQEMAHRCSLSLRGRQGTLVTASDFNGSIAYARKLIRQAELSYRSFVSPLCALKHKDYKSKEVELLFHTVLALEALQAAPVFALPSSSSNKIIQEKIVRLREALGDVCAAAEPVMAWLEAQGARHGERIEEVAA